VLTHELRQATVWLIFDVRHKDMHRVLAIILTTVFSWGCSGPGNDQEQLLAGARSVRQLPVKRAVLMASLGLDGLKSERYGGSIRGGRMFFMESWQHGSGLSVKAWDSEYVGDVAITRCSIDDILKAQGEKAGDDAVNHDSSPARVSFQEFVVLRGDKVLYSSETQGEQAMRGNRR